MKNIQFPQNIELNPSSRGDGSVGPGSSPLYPEMLRKLRSEFELIKDYEFGEVQYYAGDIVRHTSGLYYVPADFTSGAEPAEFFTVEINDGKLIPIGYEPKELVVTSTPAGFAEERHTKLIYQGISVPAVEWASKNAVTINQNLSKLLGVVITIPVADKPATTLTVSTTINRPAVFNTSLENCYPPSVDVYYSNGTNLIKVNTPNVQPYQDETSVVIGGFDASPLSINPSVIKISYL